MKRILAYVFLSLGVLMSFPTSDRAQTSASGPAANTTQPASSLLTVDQIIERATLASGGKAAWATVTSMYLNGSVEIPLANASGTFESYSQAPNKSYESISFGGEIAVKQGFDGKNGWKTSPDKSIVDIQGDELEDTKLDSDFYSEINLRQLYPQMVLQDDSTIGGRPAYTVLATPLHGKSRKFYFDKETGLRVGMSSGTIEDGKPTQVKTYFGDFKTVDGIQVPYTIRLVTQSATIVFHLHDVRTNVPVLNSIFLKPAGEMHSAGPVPSGSSSALVHPDTGGVSGNTFTSSIFGFTYTFPAGWIAHGDATNKEIMKVGKELVVGDDPARKAVYDASVSRTSQLLTVFQYPVGTPAKFNSSIQVMTEDVEFAPGIQTGKDYLLNLQVVMKRGTLPVEFPDDITEVTAGGKRFFRLDDELHFPAGTVHQAIFSAKLDKVVLSFIMTARSKEDLDTLCSTLDSLRFDFHPH
jgi:hypothetical protein